MGLITEFFYKHWLTLIPTWISNYTPNKTVRWNYLSILKFQLLKFENA